MSARYLFSRREGSSALFTSELPPTAYDLELIEVGLLEVVRLADLHQAAPDGSWRPLAQGELTTVVVEGKVCGPFHGPAAGPGSGVSD
jgi:hypothetical protein